MIRCPLPGRVFSPKMSREGGKTWATVIPMPEYRATAAFRCATALVTFSSGNLGEGQPRGIIDADLGIFPARAARLALLRIAGDAVARAGEFARIFSVEMDPVSGMLSLIAAHRSFDPDSMLPSARDHLLRK